MCSVADTGPSKMLFLLVSFVLLGFVQCQVMMNIPLTNARQSTTWKGYTARRAIDGNTNKNFFGGSCSHTVCSDRNPVWITCLGGQHTINSVTIHNPYQSGGRLKNIRIEVFAIDPNLPGAVAQLCNSVDQAPIANGVSRQFNCPANIVGQYIRISKRAQTGYNNWRPQHNKKKTCDALLMCEVQVTGSAFVTCPLGFIRNLDSCYSFPTIPVLSFFEGRDLCQTIGADLAVVESQAENNFIAAHLLMIDGALAGTYYFGLNRLANGMTWQWIDPNAVMGVPNGVPNALVPFSDWNAGEGNNAGQLCGIYSDNLGGAFQWSDEICNNPGMVVCEISPTFPDNAVMCNL